MIKYRKATEEDMMAVALCHKKCFDGTFIASWSKKLIANYYTEYLKLNDMFVIALKNDEIVGFCMGYKHGYNAQKNFIRNNRIRLASWLLFLCLRGNKLAIHKCLGWFNRNRKNSLEWIRNKSVKDSGGGCCLSVC